MWRGVLTCGREWFNGPPFIMLCANKSSPLAVSHRALWFVLGFWLVVGAAPALAVQRQTAQSAAVPGVYSFRYLLYLPSSYGADPSATWPLMIFLHGAGQTGNDLEVVAAAGPPMLIEQGRDFPCVVISPQTTLNFWDPVALAAFIQDRAREYHIDPDRIYVTGLSMGGYGTWAVAERSPASFAAVMPLCGGGDPAQAYKLRDLPLWAFHGSLDTTVPVARTQEMIDAIRLAGGNPLVTIYPNLGHDVWTTTYANDAVYTWLFEQHRVRPSSAPLIGTQPTSQTAAMGQGAVFTVAAGSVPASAYQWQRLPAGSGTWESLREGGSYHGVNTATLTIDPATAGMAGDQFRAVLSNATGATTTSTVTLAVSGSGLLQYPAGIALDGGGNIFVADGASNTIRKITPAGLISTLAGSAGTAGSLDGSGSDARFNQPGAIAADRAGSLYVADTGNAMIRKVTADGTVTTLAGSASSRGSLDGSGGSATFNSPAGIAVDSSGNIFVADTLNATIRRITPAGLVSTLAGSAGNRGDQDGVGGAARFSQPNGISVDPAGNLYVTDTYNNTVRRIAPDGTVTTLAGMPGVSGATDGNGLNALFSQPAGIAVDSASGAGAGGVIIYVADTGNSVVRRMTTTGSVVTIAGLWGVAGLGNGYGSNAYFNQPRGLVVDSAGNVFVADTGNALIRKIALDATVTTIALSETAAPAPANVPATPASPGTSTPAPGSSGSTGGGGGAIGGWFVAALALLGLGRRAVVGRGR